MSEERLLPGDPELEDEADEDGGEGSTAENGLDEADDALEGDGLEEGTEADGEGAVRETEVEPRRRRSNDTIRNLRSRAQQAERDRDDLTRRLGELERRALAPPPVDPAAAAREQARLDAEEFAQVELMA